MHVTVRPNIESLTLYTPGKPVEELRRELGLEHIVKLASNENPLGPSPAAIEAIRIASTQSHAYPDANAFYLKEALSAQLGVDANELLVTAGANEAIDIIARSLALDGSRAIVSAQSFIGYAMACKACGVAVDEIPTREGLKYDLDAMLAAIGPETRFVFLPNPNNPTGEYVTETRLVRFLDQIPEHVLCVLDEAYFDYVRLPDYPNGLDLRTRYPNLIVLRSFSKVHGLAGLRVGFAVMRPELQRHANKVRCPFNVSHVAQAAAMAALNDHEYVARSVQSNTEQRDYLQERLRALGLQVYDSAANFVLVAVPRTGDEIFSALLPLGVIVRSMRAFGLPRHVRITVGLRPDIDCLVDALQRVLSAGAAP